MYYPMHGFGGPKEIDLVFNQALAPKQLRRAGNGRGE